MGGETGQAVCGSRLQTPLSSEVGRTVSRETSSPPFRFARAPQDGASASQNACQSVPAVPMRRASLHCLPWTAAPWRALDQKQRARWLLSAGDGNSRADLHRLFTGLHRPHFASRCGFEAFVMRAATTRGRVCRAAGNGGRAARRRLCIVNTRWAGHAVSRET
jgi:hypothetical protein